MMRIDLKVIQLSPASLLGDASRPTGASCFEIRNINEFDLDSLELQEVDMAAFDQRRASHVEAVLSESGDCFVAIMLPAHHDPHICRATCLPRKIDQRSYQLGISVTWNLDEDAMWTMHACMLRPSSLTV